MKKNMNESVKYSVENDGSIRPDVRAIIADYRNDFISSADLVSAVGRIIKESKCGWRTYNKCVDVSLHPLADFICEVYSPVDELGYEAPDDNLDVLDFLDAEVRSEYDGTADLCEQRDELSSLLTQKKEELEDRQAVIDNLHRYLEIKDETISQLQMENSTLTKERDEDSSLIDTLNANIEALTNENACATREILALKERAQKAEEELARLRETLHAISATN